MALFVGHCSLVKGKKLKVQSIQYFFYVIPEVSKQENFCHVPIQRSCDPLWPLIVLGKAIAASTTTELPGWVPTD